MGSVFSSDSYDKDQHGVSDRAMFDRYLTDETLIQDLSGKVVAITGTSFGGMGYYLAEAAIKKKAKMLLCLNRDSSSAKKGQEGLQQLLQDTKESSTVVQAVTCDMQSLESVKKAAAEVNKIAKQNNGLDVLILNAGIMATRDKRTADGFEVQMQTNHLSHYLLVSLVFDSIKMAGDKRGDARVVTHSSSSRDTPGGMLVKDFFSKSKPNTLGGDDVWMVSEMLFGKWGPWQRYHQTKLANSAFSMALHEKLAAKGLTDKIKAMTSDPGLASSNLQVNSTQGDGLMSNTVAKLIVPNGQSAEDGSLSCAMCAFSPQANSGDMYAPMNAAKGKPIKTIEGNVPVKKGSEKLTCNKENQENVWKWCEEALGITFEV